MQQAVLVIATQLAIGITAASAASVQIEPRPVVERAVDYDPAGVLPLEMPELEPGRDSVTACDFWCKPVLTYRIRSTDHRPEGCRAVLDVVSVELVVELTATSWLPEASSRALGEHESQHRAICSRVFELTRQALSRAAQAAAQAPLLGSGIDCDAALEDASRRQAAATYCADFIADAGRQARRVTDLYDDLTRNGAKGPSPNAAMAAAFRQYQRERVAGIVDAPP